MSEAGLPIPEKLESGRVPVAAGIYAMILPRLKDGAARLGYAIALHGSMARDLDLVAIPWSEGAAAAEDVVALAVEISGGYVLGEPGAKPHGRRAWTIALGAGLFIDLSIVPRLEPGGGAAGQHGTRMNTAPGLTPEGRR